MARVRQSFSSQRALIDRWMSQTQEYGRCKAFGRESMHFKGDTLYSNMWNEPHYPLARYAGQNVVLVNCTKAGMGVHSYHRPAVQHALKKDPLLKIFAVETDVMSKGPLEVLPCLIERHSRAMQIAKRSRTHLSYRMEVMDECARQARAYADHYGLPECVLLDFDKKGLEQRLRYRQAKQAAVRARTIQQRGW